MKLEKKAEGRHDGGYRTKGSSWSAEIFPSRFERGQWCWSVLCKVSDTLHEGSASSREAAEAAVQNVVKKDTGVMPAYP